MKKSFSLIAFVFCTLFFLNSCDYLNQNNPAEDSKIDEDNTNIKSDKVLVTYFSCTNNTETVASKIRISMNSDIEEIIPLIPYTVDDLNYNDTNSRANVEQNDDSARPEIQNMIDIMFYDTVFVGYPIWWGKLPKIMYTFFDTYDFTNKTIIPFATSGGSGISTSVSEISALEPNAKILDGRRFNPSTSQSEIDSWLKGLNL